MSAITGLLGALGLVTALFAGVWGRAVRAAVRVATPNPPPYADARFPTPLQIGVGFVMNFLDTLGIGNFATTTAIFRLKRMVDDRIVPGTLNIGHAIPTITETFIYTVIIQVDITTLFSMITASILGAWLGAGVVARLPRRKIQIGMGVALLVAATLMFMTQMKLFPGGGDALGVRGVRLMAAVVGNFGLGALMTLGIGLYAPCLILVSVLGMSPKAGFPIMMGSCAFLMPIGSLRFIREQSYSLQPALGLLIGGIPGVLLAAFIVRELPLYALRWLVIVVVIYTSLMMLSSAFKATPEVAVETVKAGA